MKAFCELLYDNGNPCNYVCVYKYNNHKFRMQFNHRNGSWEAVLHIMTNDGTWERIEDNKTLNVKWENLYHLDGKMPHKCAEANAPVIETFHKYIVSVY